MWLHHRLIHLDMLVWFSSVQGTLWKFETCSAPISISHIISLCICNVSTHLGVSVLYWHVSGPGLYSSLFWLVVLNCIMMVWPNSKFTVSLLSWVFRDFTRKRPTCLLLLWTRRTLAAPSNRDPYGNASISSSSNSSSCKGSDCSPTKG